MDSSFIKSEQGTKAAWKGFSSQTTYIANRLMLLNDNLDFFPEKTEDLMIKSGESVVELIQVKNLSADLAMSHLSPKENDSFFRRCLSYKAINSNLILRVISFGNIGAELQGLINKNSACVSSVKAKLIECGYTDEEVGWIINQLIIEKVDEKNLLSAIYSKLSDTIETMVAPKVAFDVLINYISNLSRHSGHTSKDYWNAKLHEIATDIAAVSGMAKQYGNTILPIYEYKDSFTYENLKEEYYLGVNALPQHIRANLDIRRSYWLDKINSFFRRENIVLIRGASGQGKSSLAYRYLLDNYPERDIICVEKMINEEQAIDLRAALNGLAKNRGSQLAVYIDVMPYDINWLWLCEQIFSHGMNIKLLITIREEDYKRAPIDYSKDKFAEIELMLSKEEAHDIYKEYKTPLYLSFEEAWTSFGENGPLMEFVYMLNQADTLKNKLLAQINAIIQNESTADEWLKVLTVICYAGKNNIKIDITKLFSSLYCPQQRKMLNIFEREYFVRTLEDGKYLESLHTLRASILYELLEDEVIFPEKDILISTLKSINDNAVMLVVEFIYKHGISNEFIDSISTITYDTWLLYGSVLKAVLWAEVYNFYSANKEIILEGDSLLNNTFTMFGIADATGYLKNIDSAAFFDIIGKDNPDRKNHVLDTIKKLSPAKIQYHFVDRFFGSTIGQLPLNKVITLDELTPAGFALFWMALRGVFIEAPTNGFTFAEEINNNNTDEYLNFLVGVQMQKWENQYLMLRDQIKPILLYLYSIVYFCDADNEITAVFIADIFSENQQLNFNNRVMSVVESLRKLYINEKQYNVRMIGQNIVEGIQLPDTKKNIPNENLPFTWITQLNGWLIRFHEYTYKPLTWNEVVNNIYETRKSIIAAINAIITGVDYLYRKNNTKKLISEETLSLVKTAYIKTLNSPAKNPQCALDKYGIRLDNSVVDKSSNNLSLFNSKMEEKKRFQSEFNKYCTNINNFFERKDGLLIERIKGNEISHSSYLSLTNLISALDNISEMQSLYELEFSSYKQSIDRNEEYNQLCILATMWNYIYNHQFRCENSFTYYCKEYIKSFRRKLKTFFENNILNLPGVESVDKSDSIITVCILSDYTDTFLSTLFNETKKAFSDIEILSLNGIMFKEAFTEIHVLLRLGNELLPGGLIINNRDFLLYDDVETFVKRITPIMEAENNHLDENPKNSAIKIYANLESLPLLFRHCTQVNSELQLLDTLSINEQVYCNWTGKVTDLFITVFGAIFGDLQYIYEHVVSDKSVTERIYKKFLDTQETIQGNIINLVKSDNYDEAESFIISVKSFITDFLNLFPAEEFNL